MSLCSPHSTKLTAAPSPTISIKRLKDRSWLQRSPLSEQSVSQRPQSCFLNNATSGILIGDFSLAKLRSRARATLGGSKPFQLTFWVSESKLSKWQAIGDSRPPQKVVLAEQPKAESPAVLGRLRPFHGIFFPWRLTGTLINMTVLGGSKPFHGIFFLGGLLHLMTLDQPKPVKAAAWDRSGSFYWIDITFPRWFW